MEWNQQHGKMVSRIHRNGTKNTNNSGEIFHVISVWCMVYGISLPLTIYLGYKLMSRDLCIKQRLMVHSHPYVAVNSRHHHNWHLTRMIAKPYCHQDLVKLYDLGCLRYPLAFDALDLTLWIDAIFSAIMKWFTKLCSAVFLYLFFSLSSILVALGGIIFEKWIILRFYWIDISRQLDHSHHIHENRFQSVELVSQHYKEREK